MYQAILAGSQTRGYQVEIVHKSKNELPKKANLDFGMYEGTFVIQTYKDNVKCAEYMLQLADTMYFPADGFDLVIKDYDGDGVADDFSLGQGQTPDPRFGNFMNYFFFAVNEDGSIMQHTLNTKDEKSLLTIPGDFSGYESFNQISRYIYAGEITEFLDSKREVIGLAIDNFPFCTNQTFTFKLTFSSFGLYIE